MQSIFLDFLISLGPLVGFVAIMILVYLRGSKINDELLEELETKIKDSVDPYVNEIAKVQIKPHEYEFRCKPKTSKIKVLTIHLKLSNRSFIIQWLMGLLFSDKERIFIGAKIQGEYGYEDPVYEFHLVPYRNSRFIQMRHEKYVKMDDIPTADKEVTKDYMIKSGDLAYVKHLVTNAEYLRLLKESEPYMEHLGIQKADEETDPHIAATFEFRGLDVQPIEEFINLFFITVNSHLAKHEEIKKIQAKGKKGRAKARSRGKAKRGAGKRRKKKK